MTFHIAHNYGAMLQAYALPIAIQKLGYDCEIIDYRFPYIDQWSRIERWNDLVAKHGLLGASLRYIKRLMTGYYFQNNCHMKFDAFERKIIRHSKKIYRNKNELKNMPYDVILFGSDQIWNTALTNGIAEEYIGGFDCLRNTRKVAYAASCGTSDFQPECKDIYEEYLKDFYAISVREKDFQRNLIDRGFDVEWVLDPTLLISAEDWKEIIPVANVDINKKYLLIYAFDVEDTIYDLARDYAARNDLEIVAIAYKETPSMYGMKVLLDCGPLEFLSLFVNAEHIIAASFHGTAFSIVFHKSFHCVPHPIFRDRTDSLLDMLELTNHNIDTFVELKKEEVDWDRVDSVLLQYRRMSVDFLKAAIEGKKKGNADD